VFAATPADREVVDPAGNEPERSPAETGSLQIPCRELAEKYFRIGLSEVEKESFQAAAEAFEAALELDPASHGACHYLGFCHVKLGLYDEAIRLFNKAVEIGPDNPDYYISIGDTYALMGRYEDAVKSFERVLEAKPDDGLTYAKNAQALMELNALDKAWEYVCRSIELSPTPYAFEVQKTIRQRMTSEKSADSDQEPQHDTGQQLSDIDSQAGELWQQGQELISKALTLARKHVSENPDSVQLNYELGQILMSASRLTHASVFLEKAISIDPTHVPARLALGDYYCERRQWEPAADQFRAVISIDPHNVAVYNKIHQPLLELGLDDELAAVYDNAIRQDVFAGNDDANSDTVIQSLTIATRGVAYTMKKASERGVPPILSIALPRSGSIFIATSLCLGLAVPHTYLAATTRHLSGPPIPSAIERFSGGGAVCRVHWIATEEILSLLKRYHVTTLTVHVRDPRQCMLSAAHLHARVSTELLPGNENREMLGIQPRFSSILEYLDYYFPAIKQYGDFLQSWLRVANKDNHFRIKFTYFEDMKRDQRVFFEDLLNFFNVDPSLFAWEKIPAKEETLFFRKGEIDEWRDIFSPEQKKAAWDIMPRETWEYFGWLP